MNIMDMKHKHLHQSTQKRKNKGIFKKIQKNYI